MPEKRGFPASYGLASLRPTENPPPFVHLMQKKLLCVERRWGLTYSVDCKCSILFFFNKLNSVTENFGDSLTLLERYRLARKLAVQAVPSVWFVHFFGHSLC